MSMSMLRTLICSTIFATAAVGAVACDAFSPDLGDKPYTCGTDSPRCPDGYDAVESAGTCECLKDGNGGGPTPDAGMQNACEADDEEPNDAPASATPTPIGQGATSVQFNNRSICSTTDVDDYSFVAQAGSTMTAVLTFQPTIGQLEIRVVDLNQNLIGSAAPMTGSMVVYTATFVNSSTYFVQVRSLNGTNTYGLSMSLQ
jgi:hypothetical protein